MFGMLDYRAHKLYLILFGIPSYIIHLLSLLILPIICYYSGSYFSNLINLGEYFSSTIVTIISLIICTIISATIIDLIWIIFISVISKLFKSIFELIIDVIPADGRTKEQAEYVLYTGHKGITYLKSDEHPKNWDDELILNFAKLDWIQGLFYREIVMNRMEIVKQHYLENSEKVWEPWGLNKILKDNKIERSFIESFFCNRDYRTWTIKYSFIILLLIFNPIS